MPAGPWLNNAIWIAIAGCVYFRATLTAERNYKIMSSRSMTDVSAETVEYITKLRPVSFKDPRVLLSSLMSRPVRGLDRSVMKAQSGLS